ncbi:DNA topoisomerase 1 isoform X2 [Manduca sexta]|uniref:DNA topoisomerase 1 isoform X2 n=1 Tax=Manduca sexta TaxID=7130 RepID=UPI00188F25C5|nr:DNA topoisomerase 1 isoform X2 [Manduca sexta]
MPSAISMDRSEETTDESGKSKNKIKWKSLEHKGLRFSPPYERQPEGINFKYDGKVVKLSEDAEEVAGFYAMLDRDIVKKKTFQTNFFNDWRDVMTPEERKLIKDLTKCDFTELEKHLKEKYKKKEKQYAYCKINGREQKIKNCNVERPGLFCPINNNNLMGKLKKRIKPEDIIINCSEDKIPEPPPRHTWKKVEHDNKSSWLAKWNDNLTGKYKYIILDASSNIEQEKNRKIYETARELHKHIAKIRENYRADWTSSDPEDRQRGVAMYFIDTLAFRVGSNNTNTITREDEEENEMDKEDPVGCCNLKVKHIQLCEKNKVRFDYFGKCSVRYCRIVPVEELVYENLKSFTNNKDKDDALFDMIDNNKINNYLKSQMPNLTAKFVRTYRACTTFENYLNTKINRTDTLADKVKALKQATLEVAKLCNHKNKDRFEIQSSKMNYIDPRIAIAWYDNILFNTIPIYTSMNKEMYFT